MVASQHKPILIVIAGPNGSGKTTITTQILHHDWMEDAIYINPDQIARDKFGDWNSREARLLFRMVDGKLFKHYTNNLPEWTDVILSMDLFVLRHSLSKISASFRSMSSPRNPRATTVPSGAKKMVSGIPLIP